MQNSNQQSVDNSNVMQNNNPVSSGHNSSIANSNAIPQGGVGAQHIQKTSFIFSLLWGCTYIKYEQTINPLVNPIHVAANLQAGSVSHAQANRNIPPLVSNITNNQDNSNTTSPVATHGMFAPPSNGQNTTAHNGIEAKQEEQEGNQPTAYI